MKIIGTDIAVLADYFWILKGFYAWRPTGERPIVRLIICHAGILKNFCQVIDFFEKMCVKKRCKTALYM